MNPILSLAATAARWLPLPLKQAVYRIAPLARLARQMLNRAAPAGPTPVTIAAGALEGMQMALDLQREKDYWLGTYELDLQAAVAHFVRPGMTVYDVGANIGYISLMLARAVGPQGRVFSFEALPVNQQRLFDNIARNHLENQVTLIRAAVADQAGPLHFLVHASTSMGKAAGSAGRQDEDYRETITIPGVSLDDFVEQQGNPPPQAVKMDIEGGEILAVRGMARLLDDVHPLMLVELHGHEAAAAVWQALAPRGYTLHRMQDGYPRVDSVDALDWKAYVVGIPPAVSSYFQKGV